MIKKCYAPIKVVKVILRFTKVHAFIYIFSLGETHHSKYVQFNDLLLLVKDAAICIIFTILPLSNSRSE